ncbi:MAG: hypothetical protein ACT4PY_08500 [Armatimonadota bacterium]
MTGSARLHAYLSGPMSELPPAEQALFEDRYELIQEVCEDENYACYCPHQLSNPEDDERTPEQHYRFKAARIGSAELVIAECSLPSVSVGIVCQMADAREIPVLLIARQGAVVSQLVRGLPHVVRSGGDADIVRFTGDAELGYGLRARLQELKENLMANRRRREAEIVSFESLREYARSRQLSYARYERLRSLVAAAVRGRMPRSVEDWEALDTQ